MSYVEFAKVASVARRSSGSRDSPRTYVPDIFGQLRAIVNSNAGTSDRNKQTVGCAEQRLRLRD